MKTTVLTMLIMLSSSLALAGSATDSANVPAEKQTKLGLYATPQEAYAAWKASAGGVKILDVRTPEEYVFVGHTEMAWNIPYKLQVYQWDASGKKLAMKDNPDFLVQAKQVLQPTDTLYVMCRSGNRSAMAVNALAAAGFPRVYNIIEGMEGDLVEDPQSPNYGKRAQNGWKNAGLPWTYALNPEKMRLPAAH